MLSEWCSGSPNGAGHWLWMTALHLGLRRGWRPPREPTLALGSARAPPPHSQREQLPAGWVSRSPSGDTLRGLLFARLVEGEEWLGGVEESPLPA